LTSSPWQQNALLTAKRNPARGSFQPVGAPMSILDHNCHATTFFSMGAIVFFVGRHASKTRDNHFLIQTDV